MAKPRKGRHKTEMTKHSKIIAGVILLVVMLFILFFAGNSRQDRYLSQPVRRGTIAQAVYGIGTIDADRSVELKTAVTSIIRNIYVREGQQVSTGDRLVELQDVTVLKAPFGGTVTSLPYNVGETVFAQSIVAALVDFSNLYVTVSLEQQAALPVRNGQKANLSFDGMRGKSYRGTVVAVYSRKEEFLVRINMETLPPRVLPGMTADVAIIIAEHSDALLIPVAALEGKEVEVRGKGREKITTGLVDGAYVQVVSGNIAEGDRLWISRGRGQ
ncbi:MAG: hypothetical protein DKM50_01230 [Candidatus Margulisiibacteriota bacterium]|nr:MAG: hypothetical protein A2X41_08890 [Candidatus Margulisbacteria bacterium GWE2_39_32]PZM83823.1 MAG: hypothetical protein DKM50_01230 [Candidatus Margulisiibacteriota bacterium]